MHNTQSDQILARMVSLLGLDAHELGRHLFRSKIVRVEAGDTIIFEGQGKRSCYLLCSGWACHVRHLIDGSDQILDVRIPGDLIGVSDMVLQNAPKATEAITAVELAPLSYQDYIAAANRVPHLAETFLFAINCDEAVMIEHVLGIAHRNPQVRTAHFLLELSERVSRVGLGTLTQYHCPLSQYVLADILGLTAAHLNRTLRQLRERGLVSFRHAMVQILDRPAMIQFAAFDPAYLRQVQSRPFTARDARSVRDGNDTGPGRTAPDASLRS